MQGNAWSETTFQESYHGTHHPTCLLVARDTETEGRMLFLDGSGRNRSGLHVTTAWTMFLKMLNGAEAT